MRSILTPRRLALFEAVIIGLVAGLAGLAVRHGVHMMGTWRVNETAHLPYWMGLPLIGLLGGLVSGWLVERVAPETSGSGIPQVKAVLHRVPIKFDLRVAAVKLVGGIIALGSGMPLGREGPTVQVGAALAAQLEKWMPTSPQHRRNLIAAGAGAGLAAAFNAPIAGVLFVAEELLKDISSFTLGTAILACFVASTVAQGGGTTAFDIRLDEGLPPTSFFMEEIPFYIILGVVAGALGSLFNEGVLASLTLNYRRSKLPLTLRVGLAGLVSGTMMAMLPTVFHNNAGLRHLIVNAEASPETALTAFGLQLALTWICYGSGAPGGLFAPTLMLGASVGYLTGLWSADILHRGLPTTFALAGMGAFFAGAIRVPVTAIVIVFEMTGDFNLVLPLMVSCIVAWLVGEKLSPGALYDRLLAWNGTKIDADDEESAALATITAGEVMTREFEALTSAATVEMVVKVIARQRSCPITEEGRLVGMVTQADLASILDRALPGDSAVSQIMTPDPVTVSPQDTLSTALELLTGRELSVLPVIDDRTLVGMLSINDIVAARLRARRGQN